MTIRRATFEDWKYLLDWRNDFETRMNFHNTDLVTEEDHKQWLRNVLEDKNRQLYIALEEEDAVGTVRADFNESTQVYELSWTISPDARGKGFGRIMVKMLADQLNARIRAEIKKDNISSVRIAEYAGMRFKNEHNGIVHYSNE